MVCKNCNAKVKRNEKIYPYCKAELHKKSKAKSWLIVTILLLIVAFAFGGLFLYGMNENNEAQKNYELISQVYDSDTLNEINEKYSDADDVEKEELKNQVIEYFNTLEENGTITDLEYSEEFETLSFLINDVYACYSLSDDEGTFSSSVGDSDSVAGSSSTTTGSGNKKVLLISNINAQEITDEDVPWENFKEVINESFTEDAGFEVTIVECPTVEEWKTALNGYDFISIHSHGSLCIENEIPAVCTSESVTNDNYKQYKKDLKNLGINGEIGADGVVYALMPTFFEEYYGDYSLSGTIIHNCMCYGYYNDSLADVFVEECGVVSYYGFTYSVSQEYAFSTLDSVVSLLLEGQTTGEAFDNTVAKYYAVDKDYWEKYRNEELEDPDSLIAKFKLGGSTDAVLVSESETEIADETLNDETQADSTTTLTDETQPESTTALDTEVQSDTASQIPDDAIEYKGSYYKLYDTDLSWENAKEAAESLGGHLATVTSQEEAEVINLIIAQGGYDQYWLGGESATSGSFNWVTGEDWSWENWHYGEPNADEYTEYDDDGSQNTITENYLGIYTYDQTWNDFVNDPDEYIGYIVEWEGTNTITSEDIASSIVLTLDQSGSMEGAPIDDTKQAAKKFITEVCDDNDTNVSIVSYSGEAYQKVNFTNSTSLLDLGIDSIEATGSTNIELGLKTAMTQLESQNTANKTIVLMSDGLPTDGLRGDYLIEYADEIKDSGTVIYALGFFSSLSDSEQAQAESLLKSIASEGYFFNIENSSDLTDFFNDMADMLNGVRYMYLRIACPVDVTVEYDGETLSSAESNQVTRTSFGTITFEQISEDDEAYVEDGDNEVKVLRLKEGASYDIDIVSTGNGTMDYEISFCDDEGNYSDVRSFYDIPLSWDTVISTVAESSDSTYLYLDQNGDRIYETVYKALQNSTAQEVEQINYSIVAAGILSVIFLIGVVLILKRNKNLKEEVNNYGGKCKSNG